LPIDHLIGLTYGVCLVLQVQVTLSLNSVDNCIFRAEMLVNNSYGSDGAVFWVDTRPVNNSYVSDGTAFRVDTRPVNNS